MVDYLCKIWVSSVLQKDRNRVEASLLYIGKNILTLPYFLNVLRLSRNLYDPRFSSIGFNPEQNKSPYSTNFRVRLITILITHVFLHNKVTA